MSVPHPQRRTFSFIAILCGLLCEAAGVLPFVAPEVLWVTAAWVPLLHTLAAVLVAGGAAGLFAGGRGFGQWLGASLLMAVLAFAIPVVGVLAVLFLSVVLAAHHRQDPEEDISFEELPGRDEEVRRTTTLHDAGPLRQPLVSLLDRLTPEELQKIVLGMGEMPAAATRPILQRLQKHPDVRVQLYGNGLLNDQLDSVERRLGVLKERARKNPRDVVTRTDLVETFYCLFAHGLVAADEVTQMAGQGLVETGAALDLDPDNAPVLSIHIKFLLLRHEFRQAAEAITRLNQLPGATRDAAALHAKLLFEYAGTQPVPPTPVPEPDSGSGSGSQSQSAQS